MVKNESLLYIDLYFVLLHFFYVLCMYYGNKENYTSLKTECTTACRSVMDIVSTFFSATRHFTRAHISSGKIGIL